MTMDESWEVSGWSFEHRGGMTNINGKDHWPDCLTVWMDRRQALEVIASLASQLKSDEYDRTNSFCISMCGEMEQTE